MLTLDFLSAIGSTATLAGRHSGSQPGHDPFDAMLTAALDNSNASGRAGSVGASTGKAISLGEPTPEGAPDSGSNFLNLPPFWLGLPAMQTGGEAGPSADDGTVIGVRIPPPPSDGDSNAADVLPMQSLSEDIAAVSSPVDAADPSNAGGDAATDDVLALGAPASSDLTGQDGGGPSGPPDTSDGTEIGIGIPTAGGGEIVSESPTNLAIMETGAAFSLSLAAGAVNEKILNDLFPAGTVTNIAA